METSDKLKTDNFEITTYEIYKGDIRRLGSIKYENGLTKRPDIIHFLLNHYYQSKETAL